MVRRTSPVLLRRRLGDELRRHREAAGLKASDVAKALGVNPSVVSRLENGQRRPIMLYVSALGEHYGLDKATMDHLKALARAAHEEGWWERWNTPGAPAEYAAFEAGARSIATYELSVIPGLLQTAGYTQALLQTFDPQAPAERLQQAIDFRQARQQILYSEDPIELHAVINESALHHSIGTADVMRDQWSHLLTSADRPNITLQILPFDARSGSGLIGPFSVLEFADELIDDMAHTETVLGAFFERKAEEVERCKKIFVELARSAIDETASVRLIRNHVDANTAT